MATTAIQRTGGRREIKPAEGAELITGIDYRELQVRPSINGWTPELVEAVASEADAGNLLGLGDLCEAIESDDRAKGVLQQLTMGTFGLPLQFKGGSDVLQFVLEGREGVGGEWENMHPEPELAKIYRRGLVCGVAPFQRVPLPRLASQPQRYRIEAWHPRWLSYDHYAASGSHWRIQTKQGMKRVLPGGQFGLFMPYGTERPWNEGAWRALAFPWLLKRFSLEDRANQGETVGSPTWVGKSTQGGTEKQRQRFLTQLRQLGRNGRLVLPDGWDLELVEAQFKTYEIFKQQIDWSDQAITIAIASQLSTTEGSPGFDSGKTQDQLLSFVTRYFAKQISRCLYFQSTRPWARANTGDSDNAPYGYYLTDRQNSLASLATTFETLGRAVGELDQALDRHGYMIDIDALSASFGVPITSNKGAKPLPALGPGRTPPVDPKRPGPPGQALRRLRAMQRELKRIAP